MFLSREHRSCLAPADNSTGISSQNRASSGAVVLGKEPGVTLRVMLLDAPKRKVQAIAVRCQRWLCLTCYRILWVHRNVTAHENILPSTAGIQKSSASSPAQGALRAGQVFLQGNRSGGSVTFRRGLGVVNRFPSHATCSPHPPHHGSPAYEAPPAGPSPSAAAAQHGRWAASSVGPSTLLHAGVESPGHAHRLSPLGSPSTTPSSSLLFSKFLEET